MSLDAIKESIMMVVRIPEERISQIIIDNGGSHQLAEKMLARRGDLALRLRSDES
jgi:hypothetical protein